METEEDEDVIRPEDPRLSRLEMERTLGWLFADIHRLLGRGFERHAKGLPLTRTQWRALMHVYRNDGLTQSELAEMIDMERAPFGRLLDRLEEGQWITRRLDPKDRRVKRVHVAAKLNGFKDVAIDAAVALFKDALKGLDKADVAALVKTLERMKRNLTDAKR